MGGVMSPPAALPDGEWSPAVRALADAVPVRGNDWLRIDAIWERLTRPYGVHLRRATGLDEREFLTEAFVVAQRRNLLRAFAGQLVKEELVGPGFDDHLRAIVGDSAFQLQAFQNGEFRPVNALLAAKGLMRACDYVCRIDIDGQQVGTGVLVRPTLVATAAHVVWDLAARDANGSPDLRPDKSLKAGPDSLGRLTLTFGDMEDYLPSGDGTGRLPGQTASLHENWLAWGSPPAPLERSSALYDVLDVDGIGSPDGPWDVVLIRLAVPRTLPRQAEFEGQPPARPFAIHVLHHPNGGAEQGQPLLWSIGRLDRQLGAPPVRLLHDANTLGGSSGAPIFDQGWRIVALHQGGSRVLQSSTDASGLPPLARNRAVPVRHWCDRVLEVEHALDSPPFLSVLRNAPDLTPNPYPVIGRRVTQQRVWRGMRPDAEPAQRLLIIRGEAGLGLRFTKRLVRELVENNGGTAATLDMANLLDEDAAGFARRVAGTMSADLDVPLVASGLTTAARDIRRDIAPALGRASDRGGGAGGQPQNDRDPLAGLVLQRPFWLVLEGFGGAALDVPQGVKDVIADLIRRLADYPQLRLVLVGWLEKAPAGFEASIEDLTPPTGLDVAYHFTPPGQEPDRGVVVAADILLGAQQSQGLTGYAAAQQVVADLTERLRGAIAAQASSGGGS